MTTYCTCPADDGDPADPETWAAPDPDCPQHGDWTCPRCLDTVRNPDPAVVTEARRSHARRHRPSRRPR